MTGTQDTLFGPPEESEPETEAKSRLPKDPGEPPETLITSVVSSLDGDQAALFEVGEPWEEAWKGMPEFVQNNLEPIKSIYVHFETREGMVAFAKLIGQTITMNTQSVWYPQAEIGRYSNKRWVEEAVASPEPDAAIEIIGSDE